jgi:sialate O-acetylesterase
VACCGLVWLQGPAAPAAVKPHALISDGMVLQQGMPVPLWGSADDGEKVTVRFQGQEVSTTAKGGKWLVRLDNLKAGGPYELTIQGTNTVPIKNVLVGEVWVASGQSNMEWPVRLSADPEQTAANAKYPLIRLFTVPHTARPTPQSDVQGSWKECGPETVIGFSAVAYFFGRDLHKARNVPVGIINTSWGGTPAEAWTSRPALEAHPQLKGLVDKYEQAVANYPKAVEQYNANKDQVRAKYEAAVAKAKAEGKRPPNKPQPPADPKTYQHSPATLFNGMIASLQPYAIKGAIWYQGESNAGRAYEYRTLFPAMIKNWRETWKQGDFPFLFVQLAPFMAIEAEPKESTWAELREAQLLTSLRVPNTAMAVITDVGDEKDIHPKQKEPVGGRLALAARALAYGERLTYSGPVYADLKVEGNKAILGFKHTGGGLVAKGGTLEGFTIAGADRKFVKAEAAIQEDKIVVWSPEVEKPVAVRFGWANYPVVNLWNKDGLPASPFRTDDFPMLTAPARAAATSQ